MIELTIHARVNVNWKEKNIPGGGNSMCKNFLAGRCMAWWGELIKLRQSWSKERIGENMM